jgi:hypothetical protein
MSEQVAQSPFTKMLFLLWKETFEGGSEVYIDSGTSLLETLALIDAKQASRTIVDRGTTIAAHVAHIRFYMEVHENIMNGTPQGKINWASSWTLKTVNDSEWESLKAGLRETYERISQRLQNLPDWSNEKDIECALGIMVHTGYHLGAVRQMAKFATS